MATLQSVIKVVADIEKMVTNTDKAIEHITQLGNSIDSLHTKAPAVTEYDTLFKGLEVSVKAASVAQEKFQSEFNAPSATRDADAVLKAQEDAAKIAEATNKVFNSTVETVNKTADSIDKLPKKIAGVDAALRLWERDQERINNIKSLKGINDIIPDMSELDKLTAKNNASIGTLLDSMGLGLDKIKPKLGNVGKVITETLDMLAKVNEASTTTGADFSQQNIGIQDNSTKKLVEIANEAKKLEPTMENVNAITKQFVELLDQANTKGLAVDSPVQDAWQGSTKEVFTGTATGEINKATDIDSTLAKLDELKKKAAEIQNEISKNGSNIDMSDEVKNLELLANDKLVSIADGIKTLKPNIDGLNSAIDLYETLQSKKSEFKLISESEITAIETAKNNATELFQNFDSGIEKLNPSIKSLHKGLETLNDITKAAKQVNMLTTEANALNPAISKTADQIMELGEKTRDSITEMKPSTEGLKTAIRERDKIITELNALKEKLKGMNLTDGTDAYTEREAKLKQIDEIIKSTKKTTDDFTGAVMNAQIQTVAFSATAFATQAFTLEALQDLYSEIFDEIANVVIQAVQPITDMVLDILEYFGMAPEAVYKVTLAIVGLIVMLGLLNTETLSLYFTTSYWMALWKSNIVVAGITSAIKFIAGLTIVQNILTASTLIWAGIWLAIAAAIVAVIALVVVAVIYLASCFYSSGDAAEKAAQKTEMLKNVTESYKNSLKEILDYHTKTADVMDKMREAAMTPAQRTAQREQELQNAIDEPVKIQNDIARLKTEIENRKKLIANTSDTETKDSLTERNKEAIETLRKLKELQDNIKPVTEVEIEVRKREIVQLEMKERGIDKYQNPVTAAQTLKNAKDNISLMHTKGKIDSKQELGMQQNAIGEFKKVIGISESPLKAFQDLSKQLNEVEKILSPDDFKEGKKKLLDDLKKGLGVDKYFDQSDTAKAKKELLDKMKENINLYAKEANLKQEEIDAAEKRMHNDIKSQGELGSVWQDVLKAREDAKSAREKIDEINAKIKEAEDSSLYTAEEAAEMRKVAAAKINKEDEENKKQRTNNEVLVKGSINYENYQTKDASQDHLRSIRDNGKKQTELLAKNVKATDNLSKAFTSGFDIVG